jgi:hypothetical protein
MARSMKQPKVYERVYEQNVSRARRDAQELAAMDITDLAHKIEKIINDLTKTAYLEGVRDGFQDGVACHYQRSEGEQ